MIPEATRVEMIYAEIPVTNPVIFCGFTPEFLIRL
jgi:hypothetical protein